MKAGLERYGGGLMREVGGTGQKLGCGGFVKQDSESPQMEWGSFDGIMGTPGILA